VLRGTLKGFAVYFIPICILRRRITGIRRSIALGTFVGGVRALERGVQLYLSTHRESSSLYQYLPRKILSKYRLAIAGGLASVIALKIDNSLHASAIVVFWCLMRALRCIAPPMPYGSTIVMCLASSQIIAAWIMSPGELSSTYVKFLNAHGGQSPKVMTSLQTIGYTFPCEVVHPGISCTRHVPLFFTDGFLRATKVYTPLYLAFLLFSKNKSIIGLLKNIARSSAFLSAYCTISWLAACIFYRWTSLPVCRLCLLLHGWAGGLATLIERPSRRPELAVYCATYALESIYRYLRNNGWLPQMPFLGMLVMIFSFATIVHHINQQPAFLRNFLFRLKDDPEGRGLAESL